MANKMEVLFNDDVEKIDVPKGDYSSVARNLGKNKEILTIQNIKESTKRIGPYLDQKNCRFDKDDTTPTAQVNNTATIIKTIPKCQYCSISSELQELNIEKAKFDLQQTKFTLDILKTDREMREQENQLKIRPMQLKVTFLNKQKQKLLNSSKS